MNTEPKFGEWVSVETRMPDKNGLYATAYEGGNLPHAAYYDVETGKWFLHYGGGGLPTHWMPLPPPPTSEQSKAASK